MKTRKQLEDEIERLINLIKGHCFFCKYKNAPTVCNGCKRYDVKMKEEKWDCIE